MATFQIDRLAELAHGGSRWTTKVVKIGDEECVRLVPNDPNFVKVVCSLVGIVVDVADRPSLANASWLTHLKKCRNQAQSEALNPLQPRRLFEVQESNEPAKKKVRSRTQMIEMRSNPELFEVNLGDDFIVTMQKPISQHDAVVVKLANENLDKLAEFIVFHGINPDDVTSKRAWRSSGIKGTIQIKSKGKSYFYNQNGGERQKAMTDFMSNPVIANQDGQSDDEVIGAGALPDAEPIES